MTVKKYLLSSELQYYSKGCKQAQACISNFAQNSMSIGQNATQCNTEGVEHSTCHHCCFENLCNAGYDFTIDIYNAIPKCPINGDLPVNDYTITGRSSENSVQIGGSIRKSCPSGTIYASNQHIFCNWHYNQNTGSVESFWSGELALEAVCRDLDECENTQHQCSQHCQNRYANHKCYCDHDKDSVKNYFLDWNYAKIISKPILNA